MTNPSGASEESGFLPVEALTQIPRKSSCACTLSYLEGPTSWRFCHESDTATISTQHQISGSKGESFLQANFEVFLWNFESHYFMLLEIAIQKFNRQNLDQKSVGVSVNVLIWIYIHPHGICTCDLSIESKIKVTISAPPFWAQHAERSIFWAPACGQIWVWWWVANQRCKAQLKLPNAKCCTIAVDEARGSIPSCEKVELSSLDQWLWIENESYLAALPISAFYIFL